MSTVEKKKSRVLRVLKNPTTWSETANSLMKIAFVIAVVKGFGSAGWSDVLWCIVLAIIFGLVSVVLQVEQEDQETEKRVDNQPPL